MSVKDHTISICIIIPRPKHRELVFNDDTTASGHRSSESCLLREEMPVEGSIQSPIAESQCVTSLFECQVGNVIILEEGEVILVRDLEKGGGEGRTICMLTALHCTQPHGRAVTCD